jgi:hypothetical protein
MKQQRTNIDSSGVCDTRKKVSVSQKQSSGGKNSCKKD